jgi:hypothetical protein
MEIYNLSLYLVVSTKSYPEPHSIIPNVLYLFLQVIEINIESEWIWNAAKKQSQWFNLGLVYTISVLKIYASTRMVFNCFCCPHENWRIENARNV